MSYTNAKKHILIISQYFYPEQFRINDISIEWIKKGYKVTVLTSIPNYPEGKFYEGYSLFKKRNEDYKGVNIIRLPVIPRGHNFLMLFLNYVSFVISGFFWSKFTSKEFDIIFIFSLSPISLALPGIWYARKHKVKSILYVQDLWPDSLISVTGIKSKYFISLIDKLVNYIYKNSYLILTTSNSFIVKITERKIDLEKLKFWPQYAEEFYEPKSIIEIPEIPNDEKFNIIFTGNIGEAQGLDILIKVAEKLKIKNINNVRFNLVGEGRSKERLIKDVNQKNLSDYFNFIKRQEAVKIPYFISVCDIAFLSLKDDPLYAMTIPAKLQSYMACGIGILASASGETKEIIESSKSGICCQPGNVDSLTNSIIELTRMDKAKIKHFGENAKEYCYTNFQKNNLLNKMDEYLNS